MASSDLREMLYLTMSNTLGIFMFVCPVSFSFYRHVVNGKPDIALADVTAITSVGRFYVSDVYGSCYIKYSEWNTTVADVIVTIYR